MARILVNFPESILEELDRVTKEESRTRSELIREAIRDYLEQRQQDRELIARRKQAGKVMDEIRESTKGKPYVGSVELIRAMRGPIGK